MKVRITKKQYIELNSMDLGDAPNSNDPEYLLAYDFIQAAHWAGTAMEKIKVFESIKRNVEIID